MGTPNTIPDPILGFVSERLAADPQIRKAMQNVAIKRVVNGQPVKQSVFYSVENWIEGGIEQLQTLADGPEGGNK